MTGNGWTIPPDGVPIPPLPILQYDRVTALEADNRICDAVEVATAKIWRPKSLAQLLRGDARFIYTSGMLDPYHRWRRDPLSCPPNLMIPDSGQLNLASHVLLYLPKNHPSVDRVLAALGTIGVRTYAYLDGLRHAAPPNVTIETKPLDLPILLPDTRLVIHHGGLGIANWSVAYGKPQAVFAIDLEKGLIGHAISTSRSGVSIPPNSNQRDIVRLLRHGMSLSRRSGMHEYAHQTPKQTIQAIIQSCLDAAKHGVQEAVA